MDSGGGTRTRDIAGNFVGKLDACAYRRTCEIIAGEEDAGCAPREISESGYDGLMADVVLRQGVLPDRQVVRRRARGYTQNGGEFRDGDRGNLLRGMG